jgi:hypothetical protein
MKAATWWFLLLVLLAADIALLAQRRQLDGRFEALRARSAEAFLKSRYAAEEQALLTRTGAVPAAFAGRRATARTGEEGRASARAGETVELYLLASVDDCTNSIEDEVMKLNEIARLESARVAGIHGFFVDEDRRAIAGRFIGHLSPAPAFPMTVADVRSQLPGATTPLVLVVRSRDGKILDAHKPIPGNLRKRDAFYIRWTGALGLR